MWVLKLQLKHSCFIGNRCRKFNCTATGYHIDTYQEEGEFYFVKYERIGGKDKDVEAFIADLKKAPSLIKLEANGNTIIYVCRKRSEGDITPAMAAAAKKVFFTKPIFIDKKGMEFWEVAAWERQDLVHFVDYVKQKTHKMKKFTIVAIKKTKAMDIFFPQIMPKITAAQRQAIDIAIEHDYYDYPHKVELKKLAKTMGVSLSTYREHLRKAEKVIIPNLRKSMITY